MAHKSKQLYCKNCGRRVRYNNYLTGRELMHYNASHSGIREDYRGCGNGTVAEPGEEREFDWVSPDRIDVPRRVVVLSDEEIMANLLKETDVDDESNETLDENEFDNEISVEVRTPTKSLTLSKFIKGRKPEDVRDAVRDLMSDVHAVYGLEH